MRLVQRGISQISEGGLDRRVPTPANLASRDSIGRERGKGGRRGKHRRGGRGTNEIGGGSGVWGGRGAADAATPYQHKATAKTAAADGDGSSAKATEGSAPVRGCYRCGKQGHIRANRTERLCSRRNGVCPTSMEEVALAVTGEAGARDDDGKDRTDPGAITVIALAERGMGGWHGR